MWGSIDARVEAIAGDVAEPRLGLDPAAYAALVRNVQAVFHCAAHVSSTLPYAALRAANVAGARRAATLAVRAGAPLHHVSTVVCVRPGHAETLEVSADGLALRSGYAQSKWVAERVVREVMGLGAHSQVQDRIPFS